MDFGIPGIANGILHPKHMNRWRVTFDNLAGGNRSIPLSHQLVTFNRPKITYDKVILDRFNSRSFVAGKHTIEPIDFTVEDDIAGTASRLIQEQLQTQLWVTGAEGPFLGAASEGSQYKFVARLEMLDGGRGVEVVESIVCEGCWFENVDMGDLDYASSEAVKINITMSIDHFRQDFDGYSGANQSTGGHGG